eukprot:5943145-Lingulodinium_polyedra.AAC.1
MCIRDRVEPELPGNDRPGILLPDQRIWEVARRFKELHEQVRAVRETHDQLQKVRAETVKEEKRTPTGKTAKQKGPRRREEKGREEPKD